MRNEQETRNSVNKFELEGNISNFKDVYENKNGKRILRFDIAQNNNGNTQFVPIIIKGDLVDSYAKDIQKGNWVVIKGIVTTYFKEVEKNGNLYKEKVIEMLGFEIKDKTNQKEYFSDGNIQEISDKKNEQER